MRKEAKQTKTATMSRVQRYHEGGYGSETYAFIGFKQNKYFTSDRFIKLDENFNRPDGKPLQGYGLEIETGCNSITDNDVYAEVLEKIVFAHFPEHLFKLQSDVSISGDSTAECITQVMTRDFIRNNYRNFKLMFDTYFPAFQAGANTSCGMHTNISLALFGKTPEAQAEAVKKLLYIVNHHFSLMCSMLRRDPSHTNYCGVIRDFTSMDNCKSVNLATFGGNHYICFNLAHYNVGRIELRLVGPQKTFASFRNTMETIFHLVAVVKKLAWKDLDDIAKVFSGCNQYVYDRLTLARREGQVTEEIVNKVASTVVPEELI